MTKTANQQAKSVACKKKHHQQLLVCYLNSAAVRPVLEIRPAKTMAIEGKL